MSCSTDFCDQSAPQGGAVHLPLLLSMNLLAKIIRLGDACVGLEYDERDGVTPRSAPSSLNCPKNHRLGARMDHLRQLWMVVDIALVWHYRPIHTLNLPFEITIMDKLHSNRDHVVVIVLSFPARAPLEVHQADLGFQTFSYYYGPIFLRQVSFFVKHRDPIAVSRVRTAVSVDASGVMENVEFPRR